MTDLQLEDRAVRGIDSASGTTLDALIQADDFARSSVQFEQNIATAKANGDIFVDAVEIPLKDVFGSDYQDYVRGITRQGSKNHPTGHIATDFTDGTIKAIYKLDQTGNVKLHTLYPNPKL